MERRSCLKDAILKLGMVDKPPFKPYQKGIADIIDNTTNERERGADSLQKKQVNSKLPAKNRPTTIETVRRFKEYAKKDISV